MNTLRTHLGHLPSSVMPGEDGLCVIMGHRDAQFAILQYCMVVEMVSVKLDDECYEYKIYTIEIVDNDRLLCFDAVDGVNLAMVTCYSFQYTGHAPKNL